MYRAAPVQRDHGDLLITTDTNESNDDTSNANSNDDSNNDNI